MLYTPANDPAMMESALDSGADAVIFDLEDAVPADELANARAQVADLDGCGDSRTERCARINGLETDVWVEDVLAVAPVVDALVVPKVESAEALATISTVIDRVADEPPEVVPTLETPSGVLNAERIATRAAEIDCVTALSLGLEDYVRSLGTTTRATAVREFVGVTVSSAAAVGGLQPLYTVYPDFDDDEGLRDTARWARDVGFDGMKAVHPKQVPAINEAFTPTQAAVEEARTFVEEFDSADRDSLSVDGTFLDDAIVDQYRDLLARHRAATQADE